MRKRKIYYTTNEFAERKYISQPPNDIKVPSQNRQHFCLSHFIFCAGQDGRDDDLEAGSQEYDRNVDCRGGIAKGGDFGNRCEESGGNDGE